jgi:hypothetical protein
LKTAPLPAELGRVYLERTAVLIVSLLLADLKPGVYDGPLRGCAA